MSHCDQEVQGEASDSVCRGRCAGCGGFGLGWWFCFVLSLLSYCRAVILLPDWAPSDHEIMGLAAAFASVQHAFVNSASSPGPVSSAVK